MGRLGRNIVLDRATASLDIRLVEGMDPRVTVDRVITHIRAQGFHIVSTEPGAEIRSSNPRVAWVPRRGGYAALRGRVWSAVYWRQ